MNEPFETAGWRDRAPDRNLKGDILGRIDRRERSRRLRVWALGLAGSGVGVAALSAVFLFGSAPVTLAQVVAAAEKADSVTIVNKRIMGAEKGGGATFISKMVGNAIRYEVKSPQETSFSGSYSFRDDKRSIGYLPHFNLGIIDEVSHRYSLMIRRPEISRLLRDMKAAKVEENYDWNGRKVTRFTYKATMRSTDIEQELLADPKTKLPLHLVSMRDHRSWGDEWTYDYTPIDPKSIEPDFPKGTQIIDYREQRKAMKQLVDKSMGPVPMVQFGPTEIVVLMRPIKLPKSGALPIEINLSTKDGKTKTFRGQYQAFMADSILVHKNELLSIRHTAMDLGWNDHWMGSTTSGSVKVAGKTIKFTNAPVVLAGSPTSLNEPFMIDYRDDHPLRIAPGLKAPPRLSGSKGLQ